MALARILLTGIGLGASVAARAQSGATLDIYYIDTEGGQATLFIAPNGKSVLVDTGYPGTRDAGRILEAAQDAHLKQIDYLLLTHYHGDHVGGFPELARQIPIINLVDHGPTVQPEQQFDSRLAYDEATRSHPHRVVAPGDRLPVGGGIEWTIVSSAGKTLQHSLPQAPGAGRKNPYCSQFVPRDITIDLENAQSVGSVIRYGKFRTIDLGDLLWNWEAKLTCPVNLIGTVDLMLSTHHGMKWSGSPAVIYALRPRVFVMNNGNRKGGQVESFQTLESAPGLENIWQLHWSANGLLEHNAPGVYIANIETPQLSAELILNPPPEVPPGTRPPAIGNPEHAPAYWIKVSARQDGSFTVTNARNGFAKTYLARP
jgi:beta-lactamase superfamily II metal-dependent hydrolase